MFVNPELIRSIKDAETGAVIVFGKDDGLDVKERAHALLDLIEKSHGQADWTQLDAH
jgi:hypothetical protein